jgi:prevent-host-death family protein
MADIVTVHFAKTHLSQLLAEVEKGKTVIIARDTTPVAKLVPVATKAKRAFGSMRGKISIGPAFFEPLPDDEIAAWFR